MFLSQENQKKTLSILLDFPQWLGSYDTHALMALDCKEM